MAISQMRSRRKVTGGRYRDFCKKRRQNKGSLPAMTKLGAKSMRYRRSRGGSLKSFLLSINTVNVLDPKTKKSQTAEVLNVIENPANINFVRMKVITKGTVVETKLGKVRITSRPGQNSNLNAVLIS